MSVGDERFEDLGLGCTISVASADQPAAPAPVDSFAWDPTSVSIAVLAVAAYIVAGLYVSRWWWRNDGEAAFTAEAQILAFGVWAMWPLYLLLASMFAGVRSFYTRSGAR